MALNATTLSAAIRVNLLAGGASGATDNAALTALCDAIAGAVVGHIVASAVVVPTLMIAPPGTAGGPVTGTGSIT